MVSLLDEELFNEYILDPSAMLMEMANSGSHKYKPTSKELQIARDFFKRYKVLFSAVWEEVLDADPLQDFMKGYISLKQLLSRFNIEPDNPDSLAYYKINHCSSIEELEQTARKYNIFNTND